MRPLRADLKHKDTDLWPGWADLWSERVVMWPERTDFRLERV